MGFFGKKKKSKKEKMSPMIDNSAIQTKEIDTPLVEEPAVTPTDGPFEEDIRDDIAETEAVFANKDEDEIERLVQEELAKDRIEEEGGEDAGEDEEAEEEDEGMDESDEGEDAESRGEEHSVDAESSADQDDETAKEFDEVEYTRINTLHADIFVPLSAKSGDVLDINHDGSKKIKVPKGQQGQQIRVKMIQRKEPQETGLLCGCFGV